VPLPWFSEVLGWGVVIAAVNVGLLIWLYRGWLNDYRIVLSGVINPFDI
jgi:hypothetical protein